MHLVLTISSFFKIPTELLGHLLDELQGVQVLLPRDLHCTLHAYGQILSHKSLLHSLNDSPLQHVAEVLQLLVAIQFSPM